ncbi:MAG: GHKL domain-containing protein [Defluviitaleaceae bacterium]|nr:GHKL domain-containing protein [Defluviitaleaceae bacterium]
MSTSDLPQIWVVSAIAVIFAINLLTFYLHDWLSEAYDHKLKSLLYSKEKEYYYSQSKLMQESLAHMKSIRHDIKNHLLVLRDYSTRSETENVRKYINGLLEDVDATESFSDTGNVAFDSIINYKLKKAKDMGANLDVEVRIPAELEIETSDIVAIVDNLLDNAIEALIKTDDKKLSIKIVYSKGRITIVASNSFNGNVRHNEKHEIISSNCDTKRRHGLRHILRSVERYKGQMEIDHSENTFSVKILLHVKFAETGQY